MQTAINEHYRTYEEAALDEKKKETKAANQKAKVKADKERIQRLTAENEELRDEYALLRGRLFVLMQKLQD